MKGLAEDHQREIGRQIPPENHPAHQSADILLLASESGRPFPGSLTDGAKTGMSFCLHVRKTGGHPVKRRYFPFKTAIGPGKALCASVERCQKDSEIHLFRGHEGLSVVGNAEGGQQFNNHLFNACGFKDVSPPALFCQRVNIHSLALICFIHIEELKEGVFATGFDALDKTIRGLAGGEVLTILARAGCFKTAFMQRLPLQKNNDRLAVFFSLEMPVASLYERFGQQATSKPVRSLLNSCGFLIVAEQKTNCGA